MGHALGNNYGKFYSFQSKPVILDLQFQVDSTLAAGVSNVKGQGVSAVYMNSGTTPTYPANVATGLCLIKLAYSYSRAYCLNYAITSPVTGSNLAINASALTAGQPYQITAVGSATAGAATIAPVADVAGSLASAWFSLYDAYGNTFIIWFSVSGVGSAPIGVSGTLVQQSISTGATASAIGTALATTIAALPSGISGVFSFTASGTTTVTVTSTGTGKQLAGAPAEGVIPTGFTFALTKFTTNLTDWQKVGLPAGVTPAVGVSFIATAAGYTTGGASSGTVKAIGVSGVTSMETVGDPNLSLFPIPMGGSPNVGGWVMTQFLGPTIASVATTPAVTNAFFSPYIPTAPANSSIVKMSLLLEQAARVGGNNE